MIEKHAKGFMEGFGSYTMRENMIWKEQPDYILKAHKLILDQIWTKYSGARAMPGKKKFMSVDELRRLILDSGIDKEIAEREIPVIYNLSMMSQVDELTSERIFEMSYVEYLECLCRLADKISLPSLYFSEEEVFFLWLKVRSQI
jgi:hypothetical protein